KAESDTGKDDSLDIHDLGNFFDDNLFDRILDNLYLLSRGFLGRGWFRRFGCFCRRLGHRDLLRYAVVVRGLRLGKDRWVRRVAKKRLLRLSCADQKMKRSKDSPLDQKRRGMEQIGNDPQRIGLTVVIFVGRGESRFRSEHE